MTDITSKLPKRLKTERETSKNLGMLRWIDCSREKSIEEKIFASIPTEKNIKPKRKSSPIFVYFSVMTLPMISGFTYDNSLDRKSRPL